MQHETPGETASVRVWDLPTRGFHWALALLVIASVISGQIGGSAMVWHFRSGYAVFALLVFRFAWGLIGGRWSRFRHFAYAPSTTLRYLRGASRPDEHHEVGHSPLGAFSVFALLLLLALQVASGLFADDEISNSGPYTRFVSNATSQIATHWHTGIGRWSVIALVALHIGAVSFYLLRWRRDLVTPMLSGDKLLAADVPPAIDNARSRLVAALLMLACAVGVAWLIGLGG
jgi:cytochrome b